MCRGQWNNEMAAETESDIGLSWRRWKSSGKTGNYLLLQYLNDLLHLPSIHTRKNRRQMQVRKHVLRLPKVWIMAKPRKKKCSQKTFLCSHIKPNTKAWCQVIMDKSIERGTLEQPTTPDQWQQHTRINALFPRTLLISACGGTKEHSDINYARRILDVETIRRTCSI